MATPEKPGRRAADQGRDPVVSALDRVVEELQQVRSSLDNVADSMPHLRDEVDERVDLAIQQAQAAIEAANKVEHRVGRRWIGFLAVVGVFFAVVAFAYLSTRSTVDRLEDLANVLKVTADENHRLSEENKRLAEETRTLSAKVVDCTESNGECFKRNRQTLYAALSQISDGDQGTRFLVCAQAPTPLRNEEPCKSILDKGYPPPPAIPPVGTTTTTATVGG